MKLQKKKWIAITIVACLLCSCGAQDTESMPTTAMNMAVESFTNNWKEQYDLGIRYLSDGKYKEAIVAFTAAIEIDTKRAEAYVGRGQAYYLAEQRENARIDYESALNLDSTVLKETDYINLSEIYLASEEREKALEVLKLGAQRLEFTTLQDRLDDLERQIVDTRYQFLVDKIVADYGRATTDAFLSCRGTSIQSYPDSLHGFVTSQRIDLDRDGTAELLVLQMDDQTPGYLVGTVYGIKSDRVERLASRGLYRLAYSEAAELYAFYSEKVGHYCIVCDAASQGAYTGVNSTSVVVFELTSEHIEIIESGENVLWIQPTDLTSILDGVGAPLASYVYGRETLKDSQNYIPLLTVEHTVGGNGFAPTEYNHYLQLIPKSRTNDNNVDGMESQSVDSNSTTQSIEMSREDQYSINLFLSNFSEQRFGPYNQSSGIDEIARFTYIFAKINSNSNITGRHENGTGYYTVTLDYVNKVSVRFFDRQFSREGASAFLGDQHSFYRDGVFYFEMADGASYCYFTVVDRLEHRDDDTYIAYFHNYALDLQEYWEHGMDNSLYRMTPNEAMAYDKVEVCAEGIANLTKDSAGNYHLMEYDWKNV